MISPDGTYILFSATPTAMPRTPSGKKPWKSRKPYAKSGKVDPDLRAAIEMVVDSEMKENKEYKVVDQSSAGTDALTTTLTNKTITDDTPINGIAQGPDNNERNGNKVKVTSVQVTGTIDYNNSSNNAQPKPDAVVDLFLYMVDETGNSTPTASTDVASGPSAGAFLPIIKGPKKVIILKHKTLVIRPQCTLTDGTAAGNKTGCAQAFKNFNLYKKLNHEVVYSGALSTSASIQGKSFWFAAVSTSTDVRIAAQKQRCRFQEMQ